MVVWLKKVCGNFVISYYIFLFTHVILYIKYFYYSSYSLLLNASWANNQEWQSGLQRHIL
jgi:hypothetical protein